MTRKAELGAIAAVLLVITILFADVLFFGKSFVVRDIARLHVPERKVLRDIVASHEFPFWNPSYAGGQPFAANPTAEVFYPPQYLVVVPDFLRGFDLEVVLHFWIAAIGMFALLRSIRLHLAACTFGALTFAMSSLMISMSGLLPFFFAIVWFPWLALFVRRFLESQRLDDFALASLALAIVLIVGEPAMILQAGALVLAYTASRLRRLKAVAITAAICGAALLAASVQIVPALDLQRDTGRGTGMTFDNAAIWSMHPLRPLELLLPNLFGFDMSFWTRLDPTQNLPWVTSWYLGLLAGVLIVAGFVHRVRGWKFVAAFAVASYLLAIGRYGGLFALLYHAGMNFIRYPEKFFFAAAFLLTVFSAIAADRFLTDARFRRTTFFVAIAVAIIDAIVMAVLQNTGATVMLATAIALALVLALRENLRLCVPLLAVFVLADLAPRRAWLAPALPDDFYDAPPVARTIQHPARVYNDASWQILNVPEAPLSGAARWLRARNLMFPEMQRIYGLDGALDTDFTITQLQPSTEFFRFFYNARFRGRPDLVPMLLSFAGATHVVALRDATSPTDPVTIVPLMNPRYYFAGALAPADHIADRRSWPRAIAFVDRPFAPAPARILRVTQRQNSIEFDVESSGRAALVMSVTPHKYWRATIDGKRAHPYRANIGFQALTIPAGQHHVRMRYRNPLIVAFSFVSIMATLTLIGLVVDGLRNRAPQPPSPR